MKDLVLEVGTEPLGLERFHTLIRKVSPDGRIWVLLMILRLVICSRSPGCLVPFFKLARFVSECIRCLVSANYQVEDFIYFLLLVALTHSGGNSNNIHCPINPIQYGLIVCIRSPTFLRMEWTRHHPQACHRTRFDPLTEQRGEQT